MPYRSQKRAVVATLALAVLVPLPGHGWGPRGHRIVATLAEERLSAAASSAVERLLGKESLADVATWADDVRHDRAWEWLTPLHFVNLDPATGRFQGCPRQGCLVEEIEQELRTLGDEDAPPERRRLALVLLVHFVADLHQPLHVSHARDRGGNEIEVRFLGEAWNLHAVWDTGLLGASGVSWPKRARSLARDLDALEDAEACQGSIVDWTHESYRLAVDVVYPSARSATLDPAYVERYLPLVEERLVLGGVRLACLVERALVP